MEGLLAVDAVFISHRTVPLLVKCRGGILVGSSVISPADATNHCLSQFLHCLDPAREACQWHLAHHLDKVFMNQHSMTTFISDSDVAGQVSVDLQKLKSSIYLCTSEFGFIQAVESIYDTLGQMATIH